MKKRITDAACSLYRLGAAPGLTPGTPVCIDGPWDFYGVIVSATGKTFREIEPDGHHMLVYSNKGLRADPKTAVLYNIRGIARQPEGVVYGTVALG